MHMGHPKASNNKGYEAESNAVSTTFRTKAQQGINFLLQEQKQLTYKNW